MKNPLERGSAVIQSHDEPGSSSSKICPNISPETFELSNVIESKLVQCLFQPSIYELVELVYGHRRKRGDIVDRLREDFSSRLSVANVLNFDCYWEPIV